jgi:YD repeat-containing protein
LAGVVGRARPLGDSTANTLQLNLLPNGLDAFGRIVVENWVRDDGVTSLVSKSNYGYDRNSNLLSAHQPDLFNGAIYHVNGAGDENAYDKLNQIKAFSDGLAPGFDLPSRLNEVNGGMGDEVTWGTSDTGKHLRTGLESAIKDRPTFQGGYDNNGMMIAAEAWSSANGGYQPQESMAVLYDGFGNLVKLQEYDLTWSNDTATKTRERIFSYDALGRRIGESDGSAGTTLYVDLAGNMLEERKWGQNTTQNVFRPGSGELLLRDRDQDDDAGTTGIDLPTGIDERLYALYDAQGNVLGITDASGAVVELYHYTPDGKLSITDEALSARTQSSYEWRYRICSIFTRRTWAMT